MSIPDGRSGDPLSIFWELAAPIVETGEVTAVIYGSASALGSGWRDIDVWIDGDRETAVSLARALSPYKVFDVTVAFDPLLDERLSQALRWQVSKGTPLLGSAPSTPLLTWLEVLSIFQNACRMQAARLSSEAGEAVSIGKADHAGRMSMYATEAFLRSLSQSPPEWQLLSRVGPTHLLSILGTADRLLANRIGRYGFDDPASIEGLCSLVREFPKASPPVPSS